MIYRGRKDGFLWFDPTVQNLTVVQPDAARRTPSITRVEQRARLRLAVGRRPSFVDEQLETTTTTSTTTTTTTTVPATTTTVAATTTTAAG